MPKLKNFFEQVPYVERSEFRYIINSDLSEKRLVLNMITDILKLYKFDRETSLIFNIKLALDEAITNAINHGNKGDKSKKVFINIAFLKNRLRFSVRDEGKGFNFKKALNSNLPDLHIENGRGILLIKKIMSEVRFTGNGNEIIFELIK